MLVLKDLRKENNLTQTQLAQAIGTNQKTVTRWENGASEPTAFYLVKLAQFFHVSTDQLLGLEDDLEKKNFSVPSVLTAEEKRVLQAYRKLSPSNRAMILRMLNINLER